jgi:DNA phosphorothioation-associated putative methyltransferase
MGATPIPDWPGYKQLLQALPYGKVLPTAIYVHRDTDACLTGPLAQILNLLARRYAIGAEFNVVKFRTDAPRLSFLYYPGFFEHPHPSLEEAVAIDISSGRSFHTAYRDNPNPPILHRKELLLEPDHPRVPEFAALSAAEEQAGLYLNTAVIGFRTNWERLLTARGLAFDGHSLLRVATVPMDSPSRIASGPAVQRHKTAIARYQLSKPVKTLLEYGQLPLGSSLLDYGCGLGADVRGLRELGFSAEGWDPVHAPSGVRREADVVNLGYVLNVIEDPAERLETLASAWHFAKRLLVVSALIGDANSDAPRAVTLNDGVLTRRNTFQRYFGQQELQHYLEDALEIAAVPVALGVFYLFRDPAEYQIFLQSRSRRNVDWAFISLGFGRPEKQLRQPRAARSPRPDRFVEHLPLIEEFWSTVLTLGREPLPSEFPRYEEVREAFGSAKRALRCLLAHGRQEVFQRAQAARKSDLLVYLASANLRKAIPFLHLPESSRTDITSFFGNYKRGLEAGLQLLRSAADASTIVLACDDTSLGWQDDRSLYLHTSLVDRLSVVLRSYVACAELLFGNIAQADIIKVHKLSGKLTFLAYANFDAAPLPELIARTKINVRTGQVDTYDHSGQGQLLYFKERYLDPDHPGRSEMVTLSEVLRQIGVTETQFVGPSAHDLRSRLLQAGRADLLNLLALASAKPANRALSHGTTGGLDGPG